MNAGVKLVQKQRLVPNPVNLRMLQQQLHDLGVASSSREVQGGAELAVQHVWITVPLLQQQLGGLHFAVPRRDQTRLSRSSTWTSV